MSELSPVLAYTFALLGPSKKEFRKYQNIVLKSRNPLYLYLFASVPGANVLKIQKVLEPLMDAVMAYKFAVEVPDADVRRLQRIVVRETRRFRDAKIAYQFARDVVGSDLDVLEAEVRRVGDVGWVRAFTVFVRGES